jgi:hypothetical protein
MASPPAKRSKKQKHGCIFRLRLNKQGEQKRLAAQASKNALLRRRATDCFVFCFASPEAMPCFYIGLRPAFGVLQRKKTKQGERSKKTKAR